MLGSLLKGIILLTVSGFCAYSVIYLSGLSGDITLNINNSQLTISIILGVCVILLLFFLLFVGFVFLNLGVAIIRFLSGDETAITRYLNRSRQIKGSKALSSALISFYEGDSGEALVHSNKAKKLLNNDKLSLLINAQITKKSGDSKLALASYKKLLGQKDTRQVALSGIVSEKIKLGEFKVALELSKKNVELYPKNIGNINTLFNLQLQEKEWKGAVKTLQRKKTIEKIPRDSFLQQEAILIFEDAQEKFEAGFSQEALVGTLAAVRQHPSFVAALCFLTKLENNLGNKRRIEKILQKAWALFPHPDIAKSYASLVEEESPEKRLKRFEPLIKINESDPQTIILKAELYLTMEDFSKAKELISALANNDPDNYILALMAAVERASGGTEKSVREWLTKAVYAPKSPTWICNECGFQSEWNSICQSCDCFDSMRWARPPYYFNHSKQRELIPLILEPNRNEGSSVQMGIAKLDNSDILTDVYDSKNLKPNKPVKSKEDSDMVKRAREII
jgi:HemY protein